MQQVKLRIPVFQLSIPDFELSMPDFELSIPDFELRIPDFELSMPDLRHLNISDFQIGVSFKRSEVAIHRWRKVESACRQAPHYR